MEQEAAVQELQTLIAGVAEPISFVGALLAGSSVAVVARMSASNDGHPLANYITGSFLSSTCSFIILVVYASALRLMPVMLKFDDGTEPPDIDFYFNVIQWSISLGILSFLFGVGLLGWLKSRSLGMFSTFAASISAILILYEFFRIG